MKLFNYKTFLIILCFAESISIGAAADQSKVTPRHLKNPTPIDSVMITTTDNLNFLVNSPEILKLKKDLVEYRKTQHSPQPKKLVSPNAGGVSDGGGNAVGNILFDYFENQGSILIDSMAIDKWNPELNNTLSRLEALIPKLSQWTQGGLGTQLIAQAKTKKWYLETKPLNQTSCFNHSIVESPAQKVVGCQNDLEVRLSADWMLLEADSSNQAGLILHEMVLSWFRSTAKSLSKDQLEIQVRELNRVISLDLTSEQLKKEVSRITQNHEVFSSSDYSLLQNLPIVQRETKEDFCTNRPWKHAKLISQMMQNEVLYTPTKEALYPLESLKQRVRKVEIKKQSGLDISAELNAILNEKDNFCGKSKENLNLYKEEDFLDLSADCKSNIANQFANYIEIREKIHDEFSTLSKEDIEAQLEFQRLVVEVVSNTCAAKKGLELNNSFFITQKQAQQKMNKAKEMALNYFEFLIQKFDSQK